MFAAMRLLIHHRRLLAASTLSEVRGRYAGTTLGLVWTVLYPALFLAVYGAVFILIFNIRVGGSTATDSVLLIGAALIPFLGFSEALGQGVGSVLANRNLVKNTLFPIELIPVRSTLAGSLTMLVGLGVLQIALWLRGLVHPSQALLPVIVSLQVLFTIGVIWPLSALNVVLRDLGHVVSILLLLLMIASPIAYTADMVPHTLLPLLYANPLYYLIVLYKGCLVQGTVPTQALAIFATVAIGTFWLGFSVFMKFKQIFAEHV
jgi:lipopolysaccharide transport system permease protein